MVYSPQSLREQSLHQQRSHDRDSITYKDILSLELHVSSASESLTRTASYDSINMHTWEKSFDEESSGSISVGYAVVSRRSSFEGDKEARIEESPSWARERYLKNESIIDSSNREIKLIEINDAYQQVPSPLL